MRAEYETSGILSGAYREVENVKGVLRGPDKCVHSQIYTTALKMAESVDVEELNLTIPC